ncbi:MAG: LysR family transcriptional regulator, partial [Coriobacteriales bacterium]|nr:LysR family transcriptional regulator [Coriobacteriales bacterium]
MRITQLEYFISLAETLSFTHSAEECHVTQPVISQQISALENDLGFKLFDRTTREVRLTDAGMLYYPYAIEIVKTSKQAQTRALAVAHGRTGKLTIGVFGGLQIHGLRDIVTFSGENPEVDLQLRLVSSLEQYQELKQGAFDIMFSSVAFLSRFDDVTCVNPITSRICAVVSRNHPLAK